MRILFCVVVKPNESHTSIIQFHALYFKCSEAVPLFNLSLSCDSVLFQAHHSAHGMRFVPLCIGAFSFIIRKIIIVFLVLSYLSYSAALLLCYTFKINLFKCYSIYFYINVFYNTKSNV